MVKLFDELGPVIPVTEDLNVAEERNKPPKGYPQNREAYAIPDKYLFPIDTKEHIRAAVSMFGRHQFESDQEKKEAARRILAAAKQHGIEIGKDTEVMKASKA